MREDFLHFLWRWRRFDGRDLRTTDGQALEIIHPGELNTHAGPDFANARLRLGDMLWAGSVELHLRASDWLAHRHDADRAYDNVVLHVVLDADQAIRRPATGEKLPCLSLRGRIPPKLLESYQRLEHERAWIPCAPAFPGVAEIIRLNWFDRLLVERLEQKTTAVAEALAACGNHWEEAFYRSLARSFGLKVNVDPFETLARSLPWLTLTRHKSQLFQLEALLFGQAGLLERPFRDEYAQALAKEYAFLREKFQLVPMSGSQWKFLRLRPAGFPTVRLAQFAALLHGTTHLFRQILEAENIRTLEHLFSTSVSPYWLTHFQLDQPSPHRPKNLGRDFVHLLCINTVVPFLFHYGKSRQQPEFQDKALRLLEALPAENNAVLDGWATLGVQARNAYQGQSLLQLKTRYCEAKRCLECAVGHAILK